MSDAALRLVSEVFATDASRAFGALRAPHVEVAAEIGLCCPTGPIWDPSMLVPFAPPLLLNLDGNPYVLVSTHGDDVMRWIIRAVRDVRSVGVPMTFESLHARVGPALGRLLVLVNQPSDDRLSWHPWELCNPFNCLSRTTLTSATRVCHLEDAALSFEAMAVLQRVMSTECEARNLLAVQPEQGYILRADIANLPKRRADYAAGRSAREAMAVEVARAEKTAPLPPAFEPEFIGELPDSCDVMLTGEDRRMPALKCSYTVLNRAFNVKNLRRFLNAYSRLVTNHSDYRLPVLVRVVAKKLVRGPCEAVCCVFLDAPTTVWVSESALIAVSATLDQASRRYGRKPRPHTLVVALATARDYGLRIEEYIKGVDRPPSPHRLTREEELAASGGSGIDGDGTASSRLEMCEQKLAAAKKVLWDQAGSRISRDDILRLSVNELDEKQREIFKAIIKTNPVYRKIWNDKRKAELLATRGLQDDDDDFDPTDDAYCGKDFDNDDSDIGEFGCTPPL